jgi:recombination protein RecA
MAKKKKLKVLSQNAILKKYSGSGLASDIAIPSDEVPRLPSRILAHNDQTGGGIPYGKVIEAYGEESSGKSLLAYDYSYSAQQLGGIVLWADAESAFDPHWAQQNGLELDKVVLFKETAVETLSDWIADNILYYRSILLKNEPILLVVDSTAALDCEDNIDAPMIGAKADMGNRAKAIYKLFRIRNEMLSSLGICSIWINQLRKKVGASQFEDPDTTPGGKALAFYASIRIGIYGGKQIKGKVDGVEDRVGRVSSIRIKKNKVAPPKPTLKGHPVYFHPDYKEDIGFSKYHGLADILVRSGVLTKKKGASRYYLKDKMLANGEEALMKLITKDDALRRKLIRKSGINTIGRTQKLIDSLQTNMYPVKDISYESQT